MKEEERLGQTIVEEEVVMLGDYETLKANLAQDDHKGAHSFSHLEVGLFNELLEKLRRHLKHCTTRFWESIPAEASWQ